MEEGGHNLSGDDVVRAFIAVEISDEVRRMLSAFQEQLRRVGRARVGWVAPENIHLTLAFLGTIFRAQADELAKNLNEVAAEIPVFSLNVAGAGWFGSPRSPRVIWADVPHPPPELHALQRKATAAVASLGIPVETRPFVAHLTLGRVRAARGADSLTSPLASAKNTTFGRVLVTRVLLMQSHIESQGVRYTVLQASSLKGAEQHGG